MRDSESSNKSKVNANSGISNEGGVYLIIEKQVAAVLGDVKSGNVEKGPEPFIVPPYVFASQRKDIAFDKAGKDGANAAPDV